MYFAAGLCGKDVAFKLSLEHENMKQIQCKATRSCDLKNNDHTRNIRLRNTKVGDKID